MFSVKSKVKTTQVKEIDSIKYFSKYANAPTSTLFEVIKNKSVKPYFDYDEEVKSKEKIDELRVQRLNDIVRVMKWYFNENEQIQVFDASGFNPVKKIWKLSFRIIIQNHGLYNCGSIILDNIIPDFKKRNIIFDESVYKTQDKMQLLLLPYHCKEGNNDRYFQKVDLTKNDYPHIPKSDISAKEFKSYFVQDNFDMDGNVLEERLFDSETESQIESECESESEGESESDSEDEKDEDGEVESERKTEHSRKYSEEDIKELVDCLDWEEQEWEWDFWHKFIWCLQGISSEYDLDLKALAHEVSRESDKYNKKNTNTTYNATTNKKGYTIASLIHWAKESNVEKFNLWSKRFMNKSILASSFSDADIAEYFCKTFDQFKCYNDVLYHFNGTYWKGRSSVNIIYEKLNDLYFILKKEFDIMESKVSAERGKKIYAGLLKLRTTKSMKNIWENIKFRIEIEDDIFDKNSDLLGFTNGTYELNNGVFREGRIEDYITMTVGYDYEVVITQKINEFLRKVMPIEEERKALIEILSTCLRGKTLEKFSTLTGEGGNAKDSLITYLMKNVLGDFYFEANSSVLTDELKGELSPGIACMDKKRMVIYNEPKKIIRVNMMKKLTGGDSMPVRGLYSSKVGIALHASHFLLCNNKPKLDEVSEAVARRLVVVPFRSLFRDKETIKREFNPDEPYLYEGSEYYKTDEFGREYRLEMMNLLLESYAHYKSNKYNLHKLPNSMLNLAKDYLAESDEFYGWFITKYEKSNDEDVFVQIKDVFNEFKRSSFYNDLPKASRRAFTMNKLTEEIRKNPNLRLSYRERHRPNVNGERKDFKNTLLNWRIKEENDDSDDE